MALPKLEVSTYTLELPSTSEKIKYRPFLVKEQKILRTQVNSLIKVGATQLSVMLTLNLHL